MNHSLYSVDRTTHLKIVAVALVASIGLAGFGIAVRAYISGKSVETRAAATVQTKDSSGRVCFQDVWQSSLGLT